VTRKLEDGSVEQDYVTFYSPGTFFSETDSHKVEGWDVEAAVAKSAEINQRHGAKPYGFRFSTRSRTPDDLDAKETRASGFYYLGGTIRTYEQVVKDNKPSERTLRSNMKINEYKKIIENNNSWRVTQPFDDQRDVLLPTPEWAKREIAE
jgi:hypothetical protein